MIGQLVLARNIDQAASIVRAILIISKSETEGLLPDGEESSCEKEKRKMKSLLCGETLPEIEELIPDCTQEQADTILDLQLSEVSSKENFWYEWGKDLERAVDAMTREEGDRENAHFLPDFAKTLLRNLAWLPLWSCIKRDDFGFGRVPASSSSVESDFNHLKSRVLKNCQLPMRTDDFITRHIDYLNGKLRIVDAAMTETSETHPQATDAEDENPVTEALPTMTETTSPLAVPRNEALNTTSKPQCPVCADGNMPSAHRCIMCQKPVHLMPECSAPVPNEEEGYGEKRVCTECAHVPKKTIATIVSSRTVENWGGLALTKRKTGRYLRNDFVDNEFILHDKIGKLPIIKNGNSVRLKSIKIKEKNVTLANTCSFDSIFQIFLAAIHDRSILKNELLSSAEDNKFFEMLRKVEVAGLNHGSYIQRAQILAEHFEITELPNDCALLDCQVTAAEMCTRLFRSTL